MLPELGYVGLTGTGSTVDKHATAHVMLIEALRGKIRFENEYAHSVHQTENSDKEECGVGLIDEPGMWLCDTGARNHYSPFKYLFLNLKECIPPGEILTGNG